MTPLSCKLTVQHVDIPSPNSFTLCFISKRHYEKNNESTLGQYIICVFWMFWILVTISVHLLYELLSKHFKVLWFCIHKNELYFVSSICHFLFWPLIQGCLGKVKTSRTVLIQSNSKYLRAVLLSWHHFLRSSARSLGRCFELGPEWRWSPWGCSILEPNLHWCNHNLEKPY